MKKTFHALCIAVILLLTGCKKEQPDIPFLSKPQLAVIKQPYKEGGSDFFRDLVYNETNKIKEIRTVLSGSNSSTTRYTYIGSIVQQRSYLGDKEQVNEAVNYKLNDQQLVEEKVAPYPDFRTVYEYNNQKFLTKLGSYTKGVLASYYIYHYNADNVLDSMSAYDPDAVKAYVIVYTYLPGKKNTIGNENMGQEMFGKDQQLLVKKESRFVYYYPGAYGKKILYLEDDFTYTFDNKARVLTLTDTRTQYSYPSGRTDFYIQAAYEYIYK